MLIEKLDNSLLLQLPSTKIINLPKTSIGTPVKKTLSLNKFENYGKAGYNKFFYLKPKVRGTAKNVRDHPHGGRSRVSGSKKSPWG
jgi:ribosomal protein L2